MSFFGKITEWFENLIEPLEQDAHRLVLRPQCRRVFLARLALAGGDGVKRRAMGTPDRHAKGTPHERRERLVPVANRRDPRASRRALTSDGAARVGGACLPTGASRGGTAVQVRFLKRQLALPVSTISQ
jgi:hypothetical protein